MKLYAISDLHLDHRENREALALMPHYPDDWLILAGDICESVAHLDSALAMLTQHFAGVIWVPGNHELWVRADAEVANSVEKYGAMVNVCREFGVLTPEDPYLRWQGEGGEHIIAPLHLLYDYSFRPDTVAEKDAVSWAVESGILCADERLINPAPFESISHWCESRVDYSHAQLQCHNDNTPFVLVNHFPLRYDLVRIRKIPRFSIWCGTNRTENWHRQFAVTAVVSGHLHVRATDYRDGVRFEEVSLGYPRDWKRSLGLHHYLREILPGPQHRYNNAGPFWRV